jgi:hypothetical protein
MRLVRAAATTLAMVMLLAPAASAASGQGSIYARVLRAYENHGMVPPCQFSSQQLETALKGINTYGAQYFADFTNAVQNALAARATGACSSSGQGTHAGSIGAATTPNNASLRLAALTAGTSSGLPLPILLMAVFAGLLAVVGATALVLRWRGAARSGRGRPTGPPAL